MKSTAQYIALIRHGDYAQQTGAPSAFQPHPLTPQGEAQAQGCAQQLAQFCTEHNIQQLDIHSSELLRAWQTASIIHHELPKPLTNARIHCSIKLGERSVGSLANLTTQQIEQVIANDPRHPAPPDGWKSNSHYCLPYPGAESLMAAGQRVADYIHHTLEAAPAQTLLAFIGHGAAFRHAAHLLGWLNFEEIAKFSMYHAAPVIYRRTANTQQWVLAAGQWKTRQLKTEFTD